MVHCQCYRYSAKASEGKIATESMRVYVDPVKEAEQISVKAGAISAIFCM